MSSPALQPVCPVCGAALADGQSWCLECGAAARTRVVPTPRRWRLMAAVLALASLLSVIAIAVAVAKLVRSGPTASGPTTTTIGTTITAGPPPAPVPSGPAIAVPAAPSAPAPTVSTGPAPGLPPAATPAPSTTTRR